MTIQLVSPERKVSGVAGTGIQYLPGHEEPLSDRVIAQYLPKGGRIVDLGGGGLRFALPVAMLGERVLVVDQDASGLDLEGIVQQVLSNGKLDVDADKIRPLIETRLQDAISFLQYSTDAFDLICAFRLIVYFSPPDVLRFFQLVHDRLVDGGICAVSGLTPYDGDTANINEFYRESDPVSEANEFYRRYRQTEAAQRLLAEQNQPPCVYFVNDQHVRQLAGEAGLEVVESGLPCTRVVRGYILRRRG